MEFSTVSQTLNGLLIHVGFKVETEGIEQLETEGIEQLRGETVFVICCFQAQEGTSNLKIKSIK